MGSFHICSPVDRRWGGCVHDWPTGAESRLLFRRRFWIADICSWIVASYTNFVSKAEPLRIGDCEIQLGHCGSNQGKYPAELLSVRSTRFFSFAPQFRHSRQGIDVEHTGVRLGDTTFGPSPHSPASIAPVPSRQRPRRLGSTDSLQM